MKKRYNVILNFLNTINFIVVFLGLITFIYMFTEPESGLAQAFKTNLAPIIIIISVIAFVFVVFNIVIQQVILRGYKVQIEVLETSEKVELDTLISQLPMGVVRLDSDVREIIAMSEQAVVFFGRDARGLTIDELHGDFHDEEKVIFPEEIEVNGFILRVVFDSKMNMLKLIDITELRVLEEELEGRKAVAGFINIDNFDITVGKAQIESNELSFMLNKMLNQWFSERGVYIRQYREDRWLIVTELSRLQALERERFTVLEQVRNLGKTVNVQLSMSGAFASSDDFWSATKLSWPLIDLIENRGGDQIIVRDIDGELQTYGGITKIDAQRTQTKARAMTTLFTDVLKEAEKIYIMGHKFADADVIGATLGMKRFCDHNQMDASIILEWDDVNPEVKKLYSELDGDPSVFISPKTFNIDSVRGKLVKAVVVDTTVQALVELPELLDVCDVIVLDHHRRGMNSMTDVEVSYVEPYASSTSEMVTEMLQYTPENVVLTLPDATMLFYGIVVDSQNFKIKTGKATFAAASYLRDKGADPVLLHEITRENFQVFLMRNRLLSYAMNIHEHRMLAVATDESLVFRREELAKAADTLIEFSDIEVSIVAGKIDENTVGVSARSTGEVNVQQLMEQFGGGGHFTAAATQITDQSLDEVKKQMEIMLRRL